MDLALARVHRLGGVLHQVQQDLHQLVAIAPDRRQGRVVILHDPQMRGEARQRDAADMVQHFVDIHPRQVDRAFGEHVHPLDQVADAVRLLLDQDAQLPVVLRCVLFQQLRGAADARKRVLHLMRQHRRHRGCAPRRAPEIQLPVEHLRGGGILQRQHHAARQFGQRRALRGDAEAAQARAFQGQVVVIHRRLMQPHLGEQAEQAIIRRQQVAQRLRLQRRRGQLEEQLRRRVGEAEAVLPVQHHRRDRQGAEHRARLRRKRCGGEAASAGERSAPHAAISPSSFAASRAGRSRVTPRSTSGS